MDLVSIGEFARMARLSPKALRLYDELGLLAPDHSVAAWAAEQSREAAEGVRFVLVPNPEKPGRRAGRGVRGGTASVISSRRSGHAPIPSCSEP